MKLRLGNDFKKEISEINNKVLRIRVNQYVFDDLKSDPALSSDLFEWFPNGGWTYNQIPIVVDENVRKWIFDIETNE